MIGPCRGDRAWAIGAGIIAPSSFRQGPGKRINSDCVQDGSSLAAFEPASLGEVDPGSAAAMLDAVRIPWTHADTRGETPRVSACCVCME
jgi:hypothetical protein